jgi:hypothetical protein
VLADLLDRSRLCTGDQLPGEINAAVRPLGIAMTVYLVDHEQRRLHPVVEAGQPAPPAVPVDDGPPGRAYRQVTKVPDADRLWIAMVDGTERLGVVEVAVPAGSPAAGHPDLPRRCANLVGLIGHLVATKTSYGDGLTVVRRSRPMTPAAELLHDLMPPLTFSCRRMVVSAVLEPAYECGGDAFDYAATGTRAWLAVLDAMGRGLRAGLGGAVALAALRAARRAGEPVGDMAGSADAALTGQFADLRFVTAVLVDLDLDTGRLRYLNAGHPEPLVLRAGKVVRTLPEARQLPLGLGGDRTDVAEDVLDPGDRLLIYTDGVTDARGSGGPALGFDRLVDLVERVPSDLPTPEALRVLTHAVLARHDGPPGDDVTLMLVEWPPDPTERIQP